MPFDYQAHNRRMVKRFLWLQRVAPEYAEHALEAYATDPNSPNPNILADVKAEKARRLTQPMPASENSSAATDRSALPTTLDRM